MTIDLPDGAGILEKRLVPSKSEPGREYRMARTRLGWQHADSGCTSWAIRGYCRHVEELNAMYDDPTNETALVKIEELDDQAIIAAVSGQLTRDWVYSFRLRGKTVEGLSIDGVEGAARESAKRGEAIRELDVHLESEDENEARFVARAGRFAIMADGREVLLDVAIRAKRQPKKIRLTEETAREKGLAPGTVIDSEFWYEVGLAKAVRNAKEALLSEEVKAYIIAEARKAGRARRVDNGGGPDGEAAPARAPGPARSPSGVAGVKPSQYSGFEAGPGIVDTHKFAAAAEERGVTTAAIRERFASIEGVLRWLAEDESRTLAGLIDEMADQVDGTAEAFPEEQQGETAAEGDAAAPAGEEIQQDVPFE